MFEINFTIDYEAISPLKQFDFNITKLNIIVGRPKMAFVVSKCGEKPKKVMHISFGIRSEF